MREAVRNTSMKDPDVTGIHGFYLNKVDKTISFEAEAGFDVRDRKQAQSRLLKCVPDRYPGYTVDLKLRYYIDE